MRPSRPARRARAATRTSCPFSRLTAATQSRAPPPAVPGGQLGRRGTGRRDQHRARGESVHPPSSPAVHVAGRDDQPRGAQDGCGRAAGRPGMCTSATSRSRSAWPSSAAAAAVPSSPSTRTTRPSGDARRARPRRQRATSGPASGQASGTSCTTTVQPSPARPATELGVVAVAAAGPARVVVPCREQQVDDPCAVGHSARSYAAQATCDSCRVTTIPASSRAASPSSPACTRSASRSAIVRASSSVVVFTPANSGTSSRLR